MRKLKVYLDTSVVSYLYQVDAPEKMQNTLDLWELFKNKVYEVYISTDGGYISKSLYPSNVVMTLTPLTVFTFTICLKFHDVIFLH